MGVPFPVTVNCLFGYLHIHKYAASMCAAVFCRWLAAAGFEQASEVRFSTCTGAIYGVLIWMQKLTLKEAKRVGVDQAKF